MGPRKNNAASTGRDDGAALGKMRKINPAVPNASSGSSKQVSADTAVADIAYTAEERAFLEAQLALFNGSKSSGNNTGGGAAGTDFAAMTKERWLGGLPLLLSATEKLLHTAAEQYQITCKNRAAAATAPRPAGGVSPAAAPASTAAPEKDGSFAEMGRPAPSYGNNLSITDGVLPSGSATQPAPRPTPAAGTAAQFTEENTYILVQARQLQWYPFTYQRWLELLLSPGKYHTAKAEGRLRGDAIQASLRRCILVTYPAVEGGDCI